MKTGLRRTVLGLAAGPLLLMSGLTSAAMIARQPVAAHAAAAADTMSGYNTFSNAHFTTRVPSGWTVRTGNDVLYMTSATGAARFHFGFAFGLRIGQYTPASLTALIISGAHLQDVRILSVSSTSDGRGWSYQVTVLQYQRGGNLINLVIAVGVSDHTAYGEEAYAKTLEAPESQWQTYGPQLIMIDQSLQVRWH